MKRFVLLDTTPLPDGGALCLFEYGEDFVIKLEGGKGGQLMNTRTHGSEDALGQIPCRRIASRPQPRVLIGGLGMGFTLAAALEVLGPDAEVVVSELVPEVVDWNRTLIGEPAGHPLTDERVTVHLGDVGEQIRHPESGFDAILLDVDNGPEGLIRRENDWLYGHAGLQAARAALRPGGVLAIWSVSADGRFRRYLKQHGFRVEEVTVRPHRRGKGPRHHIWLAT
jgi:spermidine synthase